MSVGPTGVVKAVNSPPGGSPPTSTRQTRAPPMPVGASVTAAEATATEPPVKLTGPPWECEP